MATTKDLDALLESFIKRGIPGCALQVIQRGELLYEGYTGVTDIHTKAPITRASLFRLASMSKIPLYTVMMMLYEKGLFLLDEPISNYLPEWKSSTKYAFGGDGSLTVVPTERPITIKDVLTMKCGLPYCNFDTPTQDPTLQGMQRCMRPLWEKGHFTLQEQLSAISKAPLAAEPGTKWIYGFSSEIAAGLVEVICDKPVNDALKDLLFEPLGMSDTGATFFGDTKERLVTLYAKDSNGNLTFGPDFFDKKHLPGKENEAGWARLFTSTSDFSKLMQMLACGGTYEGIRIMGRKTIDLLRTNTLNGTFQDSYNAGYGYGYGFRTLVDKAAGNLNGSIGAFGWTGGFGSWCEADPSEGLSIVYMHNLIPDDEQHCHPRIRNAAYSLVK